MAPTVTPLTGTLGAEITDADIRNDAHWPTIRQAFIDHAVITIRDQSITPDDHIAFAQRWGEINVNRFFHSAGNPPQYRHRPERPRRQNRHRRDVAHRSLLRSNPRHVFHPARDRTAPLRRRHLLCLPIRRL